MTTPPAPPAPAPAPPAPVPAPPAPAPRDPAPQPSPADDLAELRRTLEAERKERKALEAELAKAKQGQMSEAEKAIAKARAEGKAEAEHEAALALVAAEFRAQAAGRLADAEAALAVLDLGKLLKDEKPDRALIGKLVEQLAAVPPPPGRIPPGPRDAGGDGNHDWLRDIRRTR